jgi:hypothetical protein
MSTDQKVVMHLMEHQILWSILVENPWPEDHSKLLKDAQEYAACVSEISGPDIMTKSFEDTVRIHFSFHSDCECISYPKYRSLTNFPTSVGACCPKLNTWLSKNTIFNS